MSKTEINKNIINYLSKYNFKKIAIFGSYVRNEHKPNSDIDILIDYHKPISLLQLVRIERELTELLGIKVDLITERAVNPDLRKYIEKDLQIIYP